MKHLGKILILFVLFISFSQNITAQATPVHSEKSDIDGASSYLAARDSAYAEFRASKFTDRLVLDLGHYCGTSYHGLSPASMGVSVGYRILPLIYTFASFEASRTKYEYGGTKTHLNSQNLGVGLGINFAHLGKTIDWDLRTMFAKSVGGVDWKQNVFDVSLVQRIRIGKRYNLNFSIGYRQINSCTSGIQDYKGLYTGISFGLSLPAGLWKK